MILLICILLTSCGSKNKKESLFEEAGTNQEEIKQTDESFISIQETEQESAANQNREQFLTFLEKFEPEQKFVDMDPEKATSYGEPLQEFYEFKGRMTKDGVGYVIGFLTKEVFMRRKIISRQNAGMRRSKNLIPYFLSP